MTVVELVERERWQLCKSYLASSAAIVAVNTLIVIGGGAWLLAGARWIALPRVTPLLVWVAVAVTDAWLVVRAVRHVRRNFARTSVAATIEREQRLRAGALRGVLEIGDGSALARRADSLLARQLERRSPAALAPHSRVVARRRAAQALAVGLVTAGLLLWLAPSLGDGLLAVRRPVAAWRGTLLPPLAFRDLPGAVLRGEHLVVQVAAPGRRQVHLSMRSPGEGWHTTVLDVNDATGTAVSDVGGVRGDVALVASDGRSTTDTTVVTVTDRPFVGAVELRATYPAYLGRTPEGLPVGEPARVPRGTIIDVAGRASSLLRSAYLRGTEDSVPLVISGQSFRGRFSPVVSGQRNWFAFDARGAIADVPLPIEIEVIPDSAPSVELVSPATDTVVATSDRVGLRVSVIDDHGIAAVELDAQRDAGGSGQIAAPTTQRLAGPSGTFWNGTPDVDLASRELQAGDALRLRVTAVDNSPWAQRGTSRELVIRVPTMEERRSLARSAADSAVNQARQAVAAQKSLEQSTNDAARERGDRASPSSGASGAERASRRDEEMSFAAAEKTRGLVQAQKGLAGRVDSLRATAKRLEEQLRRAAALDSSLARQLREAQDLLREALTPALLAEMQKLENATRELSGDEARDALKRLAELQRRLREQLERSAEMLKRAAIEGALETLKDEAADIASRQRAFADSGGQDPRTLASRSEKLANDVQRLERRLEQENARAGAERAASARQHASSSEQRMRAGDASGAARRMDQAALDLADARQRQVAAWKQELTSALDQSIQELLQMARQESSLEERARAASAGRMESEGLRGAQSAIEQGVALTGERLLREGRKSSLLSSRSQRMLGDARQRVQQATEQLADNRNRQQSANSLGDAADALNRAAAALARDRERANSATSATGFAEMLQQMQEMARRQGAINAQAQGLLPLPGAGSMTREIQATARALARQQRSIAQQLDDLSDAAGGDRAAELANEARRLAEALEQAKVDAGTLARQQQLFRRLLDAGRSLEKEEREDTDKREAKSATGGDRFDPGSTDVHGRGATRFREPVWDELRGLTAEERRAILEYFKRINAEKP